MKTDNRNKLTSAAIILSGGSGKRFGSDVPKQYLEVCGKSVLGYSISAFVESDVDEIVIVAAPEYMDHCREIARKEGCGNVTQVIPGGRERYHSVQNGLRHLAERPEVPEIVLIHDGARPFIKPETIREILRCTKENGAAIAAAPCTDTIKIADEDGCILSTTQRSHTWAAQTPQAFYTQEIFRAYEEVIGENDDSIRTDITDDAMVYQLAFPERKVHLVNAGAENFKITAPADIIRAEGILRERYRI